jgi:hypothetical protein
LTCHRVQMPFATSSMRHTEDIEMIDSGYEPEDVEMADDDEDSMDWTSSDPEEVKDTPMTDD